MTYWNRTYGAGKRSGLTTNKRLIIKPDGTYTLGAPTCPFTKPTQVIARMLWWEGYHNGIMESLREWLSTRKNRMAA